jgi:hydrogenase maturation factor HypF (carbamoyltransferase family)
MNRAYLRFPSGRTFLISEDISELREGKRPIFVFWNEETLKANFEIATRTPLPECYCYFAPPTKLGLKNITKREGIFRVILCNSKDAKDCLGSGVKACGEEAEGRLTHFILSDEHAKPGSPVVEFTDNLCPRFFVNALDGDYPVSLSPFSFTSVPFPLAEADEIGLLSLGDEAEFSLAYLEKGKITVSPDYGELAGFYEIEEMDRLVNSVMGHLQYRNVTVLREFSNFSLTSNYIRRFAHARTVDHLHSHLAAVMFDNGFNDEKGIGIVYDGESQGENDLVQGGEILYGRPGEFETVARWSPVPLPGGEIANVEPWRIALAVLRESTRKDLNELSIPLVEKLREKQGERYVFDAINNGDISYSLSSSMRHIVAAVGELLDFEEQTWDFNYFENQMDKDVIEDYAGEHYPVSVKTEEDLLILNTFDLFRGIVQDLFTQAVPENLVYKTFFGILSATVAVVETLSKKFRTKDVFLSGEFFRHPHFVEIFHSALTGKGFRVHVHRTLPVDDSGISVGQLIQYWFMKKREKASLQ